MSIYKEDNTIHIHEYYSQGTEVEIQIHSDRNNPITKNSDVSPNNPYKLLGKKDLEFYKQSYLKDPLFDPRLNNPHYLDKNFRASCELYFAIIDLYIDETWDVEMRFESDRGYFVVNGCFTPNKYPISQTVTLPTKDFLHWGNDIFVHPVDTCLLQFFVKKRFLCKDGELKVDIPLLTSDWSGTVIILSNGKVLKKEIISKVSIISSYSDLNLKSDVSSLDVKEMIDCLDAVLNMIIRSQDTTKNSITQGGLNLFYDKDMDSFIRTHWVWTWGPAIQLLLKSAEIDNPKALFPKQQLIKLAVEVGDTSLRFQMRRPGSDLDGIVATRHDYSYCKRTGSFVSQRLYGIHDSLFLSGFGWLYLYRTLRYRKFLDAAILLVNALKKLINEYDSIPMDYYDYEKSYNNLTRNEAAFGIIGVAELYNVTGDPSYRDICKTYTEQLISKLLREDGLWEHGWFIDKCVNDPCQYKTKSQAWAALGLISAYEVIKDNYYLDALLKLAKYTIGKQLSSGALPTIINEDYKSVGICWKSTAIWSYTFYKLYKITNDQTFLRSARKALLALMNVQDKQIGKGSYGGIYDCNFNSGVGIRPWYNLSCLYTISFFGLSLIEEINGMETK